MFRGALRAEAQGTNEVSAPIPPGVRSASGGTPKISGTQPRAYEFEDKIRDSLAWLGVRCIFLLAGDFLVYSPNSISPGHQVLSIHGWSELPAPIELVANAVELNVDAGHETSFGPLVNDAAVLELDGATAALTIRHRHAGHGAVVNRRPFDRISIPSTVSVPRPYSASDPYLLQIEPHPVQCVAELEG